MREVKWFDKSLTLRDGVELVSRIWVPKVKGSWPTLLMRQPYGREKLQQLLIRILIGGLQKDIWW